MCWFRGFGGWGGDNTPPPSVRMTSPSAPSCDQMLMSERKAEKAAQWVPWERSERQGTKGCCALTLEATSAAHMSLSITASTPARPRGHSKSAHQLIQNTQAGVTQRSSAGTPSQHTSSYKTPRLVMLMRGKEERRGEERGKERRGKKREERRSEG